MQYRTLGKTGWNVSAVSMGCWGIGGQWGPVEEQQALDTSTRLSMQALICLIPRMATVVVKVKSTQAKR